ncbi:hypothetical protein DPMN_036719 [Dreissena polymorpha]|uniref:Uncharacterized protein n=1 Tax=Dreissena polymorpha TaxID=45954 RepID=A0A9D4MC31_DREPO|nr:hypothetical protein DPMN_036719 [Dreissena polymorpha]
MWCPASLAQAMRLVVVARGEVTDYGFCGGNHSLRAMLITNSGLINLYTRSGQSCNPSSERFQGSSANSVGGDSGQDRRTESGDQYNIPTLFISTLLKAWG